MTELCNIMKQSGSDKGDDWHNYTLLYHRLFSQNRNHVKSLFELGIGSVNTAITSHMKSSYQPGGSLRGWREFFPHAEIYAADIDKDILAPEDRITKFYVDQTDADLIKQMWNNISCQQFDIIIDDGLHTYEANRIFFENSYSRLHPSGVFIIEDIPGKELKLFKDDLTIPSEFDSRLLCMSHARNKIDNNIMIITKNQMYLEIIDSSSELFV